MTLQDLEDRYGQCPECPSGHDQSVDSPRVSPCIHCGVVVEYNDQAMRDEWCIRVYEYVIEEEPV